MRAADSIRLAIATTVLVLTVAGCGSHADEAGSDPAPGVTTVGYTSSNLYNPCRDVSNDVASEAGLDPASKSLDPRETKEEPSMWHVCKWHSVNQQVIVRIYATYHPGPHTPEVDHGRQVRYDDRGPRRSCRPGAFRSGQLRYLGGCRDGNVRVPGHMDAPRRSQQAHLRGIEGVRDPASAPAAGSRRHLSRRLRMPADRWVDERAVCRRWPGVHGARMRIRMVSSINQESSSSR